MGKKSNQTMAIDADLADAYAPECWERKASQHQPTVEKHELPKNQMTVSQLLFAGRRVWGYLTAPY